MKFLLGSHFWNMNIQGSDKDYIEFIYPSKDDLFNCNMLSICIKDKEGNDINIKDIRMLLKELKKGSLRSFEVLYSNPIDRLNDRDKKLWRYIVNNRDYLLEELRIELMSGVLGESKGRIKQLDKKITGKELAHLQKLYWILYLAHNNHNPFKIILNDINTKKLKDIRENPSKELYIDLKKKFNMYINIDFGKKKEKRRLGELEELIKSLIFQY